MRTERAALRTLVSRDAGVDLAGPGVDAAGDRLSLVETLLAQPVRYGERAGTVVAEHEDGRLFIEFLVRAARYLIHGKEGAGFDVRGLVLPWFPDVEEKRRVVGGEESFGLGDGDFEIHGLKIQRVFGWNVVRY